MSIVQQFHVMDKLQVLGRSLMLPIAVLPIAGILLRLGQSDLLNISVISAAGSAIFDHLSLIFAIGVATGVSKDSHGATALAGVVGYLVMEAVLNAINPAINMGVLGGIIIGITAGLLYNRYHQIKLPEYLAFFGGRRFVPIATGVIALILGYVFGYIWPPIQDGLNAAGTALSDSGSLGLFIYGVLNRVLIVTGLHHVINNFVWFQLGDFHGIHGDLNRYFHGDPTAGGFMTGFFPVMMFGLPAAALAMYRTALPERRAQVGGLLFSLALTSFLTGVTEPLEFSFMFLSPLLFGIHAVLTGISMAVMQLLGVHLGFTFSAGAFDYVLSYGLSTRGWVLLPVGAVYFVIYYAIFHWAIVHFDLKVPGRDQAPAAETELSEDDDSRGKAYVHALGGATNIASVGACTTRLRLIVTDQALVDEAKLKGLGARGVLKLKGGNTQIVVGPIADSLADEVKSALQRESAVPIATPSTETMPPVEESSSSDSIELPALEQQDAWIKALGGQQNLQSMKVIAQTRVSLVPKKSSELNEVALKSLGVQAIQKVRSGAIHLVFDNSLLPLQLSRALN